MRQYKLIIAAICLLIGARASATTLYLHDAYSPMGTPATSGTGTGCANGLNDWAYRTANTTRGAAAVSYTFQPTATAPPCIAQTQNSGEFLIFASPPISAAVTISGGVDYRVGCIESQNGANMGVGFKVMRWTPWGGIVSVVHTSGNSGECSRNSYGLETIGATNATSTTFQAGDRIIIHLEIRASNTWGGNSSRTVGVSFDDASGTTGDAYVNFASTITFSADTAPKAPSVR